MIDKKNGGWINEPDERDRIGEILEKQDFLLALNTQILKALEGEIYAQEVLRKIEANIREMRHVQNSD